MRSAPSLSLIVLLGLSPAIAEAGEAGEPTIALYERAQGQHAGDDAPDPSRIVEVGRSALKLTEIERFDVQYRAKRRYRGVSVRELVRHFAPGNNLDMVLLSFSNGMIVPLPLDELELYEPFVAYETFENKVWTGKLASIHERDEWFADARPIEFAGNKIVVDKTAHPMVPAPAVFSPWNHVDTLKALEFVNEAGYYAQFDISRDTRTRSGFGVFKESCQYCHGARGVGATHGWDFVEPMPVYTYRSNVQSLYSHIYYRPADAAARGQLMPALRHISQREAGLLLGWLEAISNRAMPPYRVPIPKRK